MGGSLVCRYGNVYNTRVVNCGLAITRAKTRHLSLKQWFENVENMIRALQPLPSGKCITTPLKIASGRADEYPGHSFRHR